MLKKVLLNAEKQPGVRLKVALNCCFAALLVFLITFQQSAAFAANQRQEILTSPVHPALLLKATVASGEGSQHLPLKAVPLPGGQELPYETDIEEDFDNDWDPLAFHHSAGGIRSILLSGTLFVYHPSSIQKQVSVPFFILYHSWKSFLN